MAGLAFQRRLAVVAWRGSVARAWEDNRDGEVAAGLSCAARGGGEGQQVGGKTSAAAKTAVRTNGRGGASIRQRKEEEED